MIQRNRIGILIIISTIIVGCLIIMFGRILSTEDDNKYDIEQEFEQYVNTTYYVTKAYYNGNTVYSNINMLKYMKDDTKCIEYNIAKSMIDKARRIDNYKCNKDKDNGKK